MFCKALFENASWPIVGKVAGDVWLNVILVKLVQEKNAEPPMLVTKFGIVILVKLLHSWNAAVPMIVTESGIVIFVKLLHPYITPYPMLVIESGIIIFVNPKQA